MRLCENFRSKTGILAGRTLIFSIWTSFILLIGIVLCELMLFIKWEIVNKKRQNIAAELSLHDGYTPFTLQHINPNYLFFFNFDLKERRKINNKFCSVTKDGFRGLGPEHAGSRKLAFLLGGSSAFGHYASSDNTTISGYLNKIQDDFFFVNAGVPSWNSTQELFRLVNQIISYKPDLVIAYNGANDIAIMLDFLRKGLSYPPGTPENFDRLYAIVGDIKSGEIKLSSFTSWYEKIFPRITKSVRYHFLRDDKRENEKKIVVPKESFNEHVGKYLNNLDIMDNLVKSYGGRFIGIFQPIAWLHNYIPESKHKNFKYKDQYKQFHDAIFDKHNNKFEFLDFSNIFDSYFQLKDASPLAGRTIFVDGVHIFDAGNKVIAEKIHHFLKTGKNRSSSN